MNKLPKGFLDPQGLFCGEEKHSVLVALSGGPDSTALLHMMCVCRESLGFQLYAAHVNHNIRTEKYNGEAARDEQFCRELCQRLGVELFVLSADIPALARDSGESTETVARRVRYGFFAELMQEHGIALLLTAHNSNDNLETQIFNLCRGSGVQGLCGIPQTRGFSEGNGRIVRPLLRVSRDEILSYCERNSLPYVTDSTNLEQDYTRNKLRTSIIPVLCEIFGDPLSASARLSVLAREDNELISDIAGEIYSSLPQAKLLLDEFNTQHIAIKRRLICMRYRELSSRTLEAVHLDAVIKLAARGVPHSSTTLPDGVSASIEDRTLLFTRDTDLTRTSYDINLHEGMNPISDTDYAILILKEGVDGLPKFDEQIYKLYTSAKIKNATIESLRARSRRDGDCIVSGGMTKRVKKLMCDRKMPISERYRIPLIESDGELIYVPLCAIADRVAAKSHTDLYIYILKAKGHEHE